MKPILIPLLALTALAARSLAQSDTLTINPGTGRVNIPSGVTPLFSGISIDDKARKVVAVTAIAASLTTPVFTAPGHQFSVGNKITIVGFDHTTPIDNWNLNSKAMTVATVSGNDFTVSGTFTSQAQSGLTDIYTGLIDVPQLDLAGNRTDTYGSSTGNLHIGVAPGVNDNSTSIVLDSTGASAEVYHSWLFGAQPTLQVGPRLMVLTGATPGVGAPIVDFDYDHSTIYASKSAYAQPTGNLYIKPLPGPNNPTAIVLGGTGGGGEEYCNWISGTPGSIMVGDAFYVATGFFPSQGVELFGVTGSYVRTLPPMSVGAGVAADSSAELDVVSTSRGFLPPRMTESQRNAISSPAVGLVIFQTDNSPGLRVWNGTNWMRFTETSD